MLTSLGENVGGRKDSTPQETKGTTHRSKSLKVRNKSKPNNHFLMRYLMFFDMKKRAKRNTANRNVGPMQLWRYF